MSTITSNARYLGKNSTGNEDGEWVPGVCGLCIYGQCATKVHGESRRSLQPGHALRPGGLGHHGAPCRGGDECWLRHLAGRRRRGGVRTAVDARLDRGMWVACQLVKKIRVRTSAALWRFYPRRART